jgi:hypothetical protein
MSLPNKVKNNLPTQIGEEKSHKFDFPVLNIVIKVKKTGSDLYQLSVYLPTGSSGGLEKFWKYDKSVPQSELDAAFAGFAIRFD